MTKKLSRRERERLRHRKEILEAACEVFAEKGFRRSTIHDVAARSEFSVASIYRHFESKEDIYHSLIEDVLQMYNTTLRRKTQDAPTPLHKLVKAISLTFDMVEERHVFLKFLLAEFRPNLQTDSGQVPAKSAQMYWKIIEFYNNTFQEAIRAKQVIKAEPLALTIGLLGMIYSFVNYWLSTMQEGPLQIPKEDREIVPKLFFQAVALKKLPTL